MCAYFQRFFINQKQFGKHLSSTTVKILLADMHMAIPQMHSVTMVDDIIKLPHDIIMRYVMTYLPITGFISINSTVQNKNCE